MLASLRFVVDSKLKPLAKYNPVTKTLVISKDPRKVAAEDRFAWGQTVWHEVTHAFEDQHGDIGLFDPEPYSERNVDYMISVANTALHQLEVMELNAKAGDTVEALRANWQNFLKQTEAAAKLNPDYPPDLTLMHDWFGFQANPEEIKARYLTNKAFSGKKWKNLRKALTPAFKPGDWAGTWSTNALYGQLTLNVSGNSVTGAWEYPYWAREFEGTVSADAGKMTGTWLMPTNLVVGPEYHVVSFDVHLLVNTLGAVCFQGTYAFDVSSNVFEWEGWRP